MRRYFPPLHNITSLISLCFRTFPPHIEISSCSIKVIYFPSRVPPPMLRNEAGMRGRRETTMILVVVQWQEVSKGRKNGGEGSFTNVSTRANRVVAERSAHRIGQTEPNLNNQYNPGTNGVRSPFSNSGDVTNSTFNKHDHVFTSWVWTDFANSRLGLLSDLSACSHFSCPPLISTSATNGRLPTTQRLLLPNLPALSSRHVPY